MLGNKIIDIFKYFKRFFEMFYFLLALLKASS